MASGHGSSVGLGAGSTRGGAPGSPPRPMEGRVGDGPGGAGACFIKGFLSVAAPASRQSFRYDGPRPPPSGQTLPESVSEEEDEDEAGEGEEDEENEGSGDDSEEGWDPEKHGGGEGGDDDEDHEMDDLEPEEVQEAVGEEVGEGGGVGAATEAGSQHVAEGGGSLGVKVGRKPASLAGPRVRKKANKVRERAYPATFTGEPLGDALEYWRTATNMQTLRRMARDYLAIPATSASSERVFSLGRNLISWKRHRLASQRTRAVMILKSWYSSHPGQRIGEGRRAKGVAPPEFAIEGEGEEEDDEEEEEEGEEEWEEEQEGVGAGDTAGGEQAVVGSSSGVQA
ncbi:unnamed protein product [Closterium sp. Naga37s-1]|nr:unnamed protein product [Closterium sp. Naga37s-1]